MKAFQRCLDPEMVHHCWIPTVDLSSWENQRNWVCEVELRGCGLNSSLGYQTWCHIVNFHVTLKMVKNLPANARRHRRPGFNPWVRKIPWRRAWQPTPIFLPEESHGQRSLEDCSPWDHRVKHNWSDLTRKHNTGKCGTHFFLLEWWRIFRNFFFRFSRTFSMSTFL